MVDTAPRARMGFDIQRLIDPKSGTITYTWDESDIAVSLSDITENHQGLVASFAAECPIGSEVKSGIKVFLDKDASRKSTIRAMHDPALRLDFKEWDTLIESACAETVRAYKETKAEVANEVPEAFSADDILAMDTPPTPWLVRDLLVKGGVTLLASLPKKGKTVWAMNLAGASLGQRQFLDRDIPSMPILFLALEDTWARLKQRMSTMGINGKVVTFAVHCDLTQGLEPLRRLCEKYGPSLVVIDTLLAALRIKDENSPELGIAVQGLADLTRDLQLSTLLLHHHGKSRRDDPILDLRGHTSLSGAVDVILGLYPEEIPGQFKLKSASRDGEALDLDLAYDGKALRWEIDTAYNEIQKIETAGAMLTLLGELGPVTIEAIGQANGKSRQANDRTLKRLTDSGDVVREASKVGYQTMFVYRLTR